MTTNDNWGWRARIGLFIVGNEAVPEAEWWAMAPSGVSVHAARVTFVIVKNGSDRPATVGAVPETVTFQPRLLALPLSSM